MQQPESPEAGGSSRPRRSKGLRIALLSPSQLARDLTVEWLRKVAKNCRISVLDDAQEAVRRDAPAPDYDLVVLGHYLHDASPGELLETVALLRDGLPRTPVVVLAGSEDAGLVVEALRRGVRGYIPTRLPVPVAVAAVKLVLSGGTFAPPAALPAATDRPAAGRNGAMPPPGRGLAAEPPPGDPLTAEGLERLNLSPRECEVLMHLQLGRSNRQIAEELRISQNTVIVHVRHLMRKLGATNRTQAVFRARHLLRSHPEPGQDDLE